MSSYMCPYCRYPVTPDTVLFRYNFRERPYLDRRYHAFCQRCDGRWNVGEQQYGLYFLASDAEETEEDTQKIRKDKEGFPTRIPIKPRSGRTPSELEAKKDSLFGDEPLKNYFKSETSPNTSAPTQDNAFGSASFGTSFGAPSAVQPSSAENELKPSDETIINVATRVCPNCHNELPPDFGQIPTIDVSMLGGQGAGKTAYLLSLTHQLDTQLRAHQLGSASLLEPSERYYKYLNAPYQSTGTTESTERDIMLFPFVFLYESAGKDKRCYIRIYDIAGETTQITDEMVNHTGTMHASTLLMILDPNQLNNGWSSELYQQQNKTTNGTRIVNPSFTTGIEDYIDNSIRDPLRVGAFENIKHVVAVFSKMDMFLETNPKYFGAGRETACYFRYDLGKQQHYKAVDKQLINLISHQMNKTIWDYTKPTNLNLVEYIKNAFGGKEICVQLLGVSTYTLRDRINIQFVNQTDPSASKHRIIEPFLCILAENGMVDYRESPSEQASPKQPQQQSQEQPRRIKWRLFG